MKGAIKNHHGFSLIELLVVISILAILTAITVPNMGGWLMRHRLGGAAREVMGTLRNARMTAARENTAVAVRFNTANDTYTVFVDDGAGSGDGDNNSIPDGARDLVLNGTERVIYSGRTPNQVDITAATFAGNPAFSFDRKGFPLDPAGNLTNGSVTLADSQGTVRQINLLPTGHASIQ